MARLLQLALKHLALAALQLELAVTVHLVVAPAQPQKLLDRLELLLRLEVSVHLELLLHLEDLYLLKVRQHHLEDLYHLVVLLHPEVRYLLGPPEARLHHLEDLSLQELRVLQGLCLKDKAPAVLFLPIPQF